MSMTGATSDPRIPEPDVCVLGPVLERWARDRPQKVFARFEDGREWTYAATLEATLRTAAGLQALGVRQGDNVLSWLPNGPDALRVWFALNWLGAVYVPINTAYKGAILGHVVRNAKARLIVVHAGLADRLADIDTGALTTAVALGGEPPVRAASLTWLDGSAIEGAASALRPPEEPVRPWHNQSIIYTSGTTGPSKGVESTYLHLYSTSADPFPYLDESDRYLVTLPLFHVGGTVAVYSMLLRGASTAIVDSFRLDTFWRVAKETESTFTVLLGSMATLLAKVPVSPYERDHKLKHALVIPLSDDPTAFRERFGCDVYTLFNMTEVSVPLVSHRNPTTVGACGRPRPGVEARLADQNDCEVARGSVGELLVRADRPWAMTHGYFDEPAATARAWRNGWFHTGDAFRQDERGEFYFVDRIKDAIRRRGENISSFEVEAEVCSFPGVWEAAAVAVPSPDGEEEVLVAVVPAPGKALAPEDLVRHLIPRMPHFMVPRYVRIVEALPKTPTQKVQKALLRAEGVSPDVWDREAAGIKLRRTTL
jgi:carnitine-CoA ligase